MKIGRKRGVASEKGDHKEQNLLYILMLSYFRFLFPYCQISDFGLLQLRLWFAQIKSDNIEIHTYFRYLFL